MDFSERDGAELGTSFLEFYAMPIAAAGPQPFAGLDGEIYYCNRGEIRTLRDDALVARAAEPLGLGMLRVANLGDCQLLGLAGHDVDPLPTTVCGVPRSLNAFDGTRGTQRPIALELPVIDMATSPQTGDVLLAIETDEAAGQVNSLFDWSDRDKGRYGRPGQVDATLAFCSRSSGAPIRILDWSVRSLRGLDCTPDGCTIVCGGEIGGVQGVYISDAAAEGQPTLLERDAALPSVRPDGRQVALVPYDRTRICDLGRFHDAASVRVIDLESGNRLEIAMGKHALVCAVRYVQSPAQLLACGMRSDRSGNNVEWVIWSIDEKGRVQVLRSWRMDRGEVMLDEPSS